MTTKIPKSSEAVLEYQRAYYAKNKEAIAARKAKKSSAQRSSMSESEIKAFREKRRAESASYYRNNLEKFIRRRAETREKMKAYLANYNPNYYRNNKPKFAAASARRRAAVLRSTPSWAIHFFIDEAYDLASRRTESTGFSWHVDHIVPLQSKIVCGLHTHTNIQVIPAVANIIKANTSWPDMP